MAIRLYSEFKSDNGTQYKIEIHDASWVAAATTFNVDSRGFDLIYEGETDDIVSPIVSSRLTFGAYSENATFETFINTLKTFQENRFQLAVRKYNGASYDLIWAGWITQDLVSVEDESQPYIYEITATDGIGRLSNIDYTTANTISQANGFKATDIIAILKTAFVNIGTSDLWGAGDAFFETSIDWWETNYQTYATSTDPISQHAVDVRLFNEFDDDGNVVYSSTLDILRQIATLYNGRFYMQNGRFVFEQYGNRDTASRYVSRYTKAGTHLGRVLVSDDKTIDQTANAARRSGNGWDFLPATQTARVHYVQKFLNPFNAFGLFRFRNSTNAYTAGFIAGGSGIQLSIGSTSFNFKVTGSASLTSPIFPVFKMRIRIQDSSTGTYYYYNRSYNGVAAGGAMFGTPAWSTTSGFYYFDLPPFFTSGVSVVNQPVSIITDDMPVNGELDLQLTLHGVFRSKNGTTYTPSTTPLFDSIFVFGIQTNGSANAPGATFSSNNTTAGIDSKLTLDLGDLFIADGPRQTGHLAVFTGADWVGTSDWRKGSSGASLPILKLLTNETLALHVNPIEQYNGNVITSTLFGQRLVFNSAAYLMTGGTFNASSDEWSGTWYKIESVRANVTALTPVSDLVQKATIATATTSGSSSNDIIGGRIGGMVVDIEDQKIGPFQQTAGGARLVGNTEITGTLDVDGAAQFNNDVNITGSVTSTGPLTGEYVQLDTTYNTTPIQGQIVWSQDDGTIDVGLNSNVTMQVGQEQFWFVKNQTGSTIPKGTAVRAAGTLGASGRILGAPMVADGSVPARFFLGIAAEDILNGGDGYVTTFGKIRQLNTSAFTEGSVLWCNPAVAGGLTSTEPSAPNLKLAVAFVVRSNATSGVLAVRSEIGARVADASDVQITSVADNDLLQYNTSTSRWENVAGTTTNIAEGTNLYYTDARSRAAISETIDGVSYNNTTGVFSLDAGRVIVTTTQTGEWDTAYNDRIVSAAVTGTTSKTLTLTQGDGGTITATWSDYDTAPVTSVNGLTGDVVLTTTNIGEGTNLYYTDARARAALSAGVGISYNNTTGVITNSAPDQVVAITASTAIAVTGTYPNFTIENTAPDQVVAVTAGTGISVTGTYPNFTITNTSPSSGGTITGGGTTNYLSKWTGASALGDSLVFDNGTNVGIGTATPGAKLQVSGAAKITGGDWPTAGAGLELNYTSNTSFVGSYDRTNSVYKKLFFFGEDTTFETQGSVRMYIGTNGNVGIGTTNPYEALDVVGNIRIGNYTTAGTRYIGYANNTFGNQFIAGMSIESTTLGGNYSQKLNFVTHYYGVSNGVRMTIDEAGNVGIGTTAPKQKLIVEGTLATKPSGVDGYYSYLRSNWAENNAFELGISEDGASNFHKLITSSDYYFGSTLQFWTSDTEKMRITSAGNVGIGNTSPNGALSFADDVNTRKIVLWDGAANNNYQFYGFGVESSTFINSIYDTADRFLWVAGSGSTSRSEVMVLTGTGRLGIGTTSPASKLQVSGTNVGAPLVTITETSAAADRYSQLEFAAGNRRGYIWLGNENTSSWAGAGGLNIYTATGNMDLWTNDVQRVRIDTSGNVGIGTTSPLAILDVYQAGQPQLRVRGTTGANHLYQDSTTGTTINDGLFVGIGGDQTGYIYHYESNPLVFATSNAERMRITAGGNVGIGTTAPSLESGGVGLDILNSSYTQLRVRSSSSSAGIEFKPGSGDRWEVQASTSNQWFVYNRTDGEYRLLIDGSGNVGIGTTAPVVKLHVADSGGGRLILQGVGGSGINWQLNSYTDGKLYIGNYGVADYVTLTSAGNVGIGTTSPGQKLDVIGQAAIGSLAQAIVGSDGTYGGYSTIGFGGISNGYNRVFGYNGTGDGLFLTAASGQAISFWTNGQSTTRMIIAANGNVGIGTTSPSYKLDINGITRFQDIVRFKTNAWNLSDDGQSRFYFGNSGRTYFGSTDGYEWRSSADTALAVITNGGNVGIGTTAPTARLTIGANTSVQSTNGIALGVGETSLEFVHATFQNGFGSKLYSVDSGNGITSLRIATRPNSTSWSDAVTIIAGTSGNGNVGIGTTAPSSKLHVYQSNSEGIYLDGLQEYTTFKMLYGGNQKAEVVYQNSIDQMYFNKFGTGTFAFYGGNVGIGASSPTEKLHVDGNAVLTYNNSYQGINSIGNKAILARVSPTTGIINYAEYATATNLNGFVMGSTATQLKGIFATNKLEFTTNSSTRMTITSTGLVGIGTTSPSNILHITDVMRMDNVSAYSPNLSSTSAPKYGYGDVSNDRYLAEPVIWFKINVDGTEYVIPGYTEVI